jgi:hypothetical protein
MILLTSHSAEDFSVAADFNVAGDGKMNLGRSPFCSITVYAMMMTYDWSK